VGSKGMAKFVSKDTRYFPARELNYYIRNQL